MADPSDQTMRPPDPPDPPNPSTSKMQSASMSTPGAGRTDTLEPLSSSPNSSSSTPPWVRWSRGLNALLDDPQGQDLFKTYLEQEGCYLQLTFLWACEGLKCTAIKDPPKIPDLVRKIYNFFIPNLIGLSDTVRLDLAKAILDGKFTEIEIFNKPEEEVLAHMKDHLYPTFLQSELYLSAANGEDLSSSSASGSGRERRQSEGDESVISIGEEEAAHLSYANISQGAIDPLTGESITSLSSSGLQQLSPTTQSPPLASTSIHPVHEFTVPNQLQTVHEDKELNMNTNSQVLSHSSKIKLTKDALRATQRQRATDFTGMSKPRKNETPIAHYLVKHPSAAPSIPFPYHASYASYNPVSRVDSEIQSMSSDAMTEDGGSHHSDRKHGCRSSHRSSVQAQQHRSHVDGRHREISGVPNLNYNDNLLVIRRCTVLDNKPGFNAEKDPERFAAELISKLELVMLGEDRDKKCQKKLLESGEQLQDCNVLAAAINKIQHRDEELPSEILDNHMLHVSHVFGNITPKTKSPKLRSPTVGRRRGGHAVLPVPPPTIPAPVHRIRERDLIASTYSIDSGNVQDYSESSPMMTKPRLNPQEIRTQHDRRQGALVSPFGVLPFRGHHLQSRGAIPKYPLGYSKKLSTEYLDSGISVVSGATSNPLPLFPKSDSDFPPADQKVRQWVDQCGEDSRIRRQEAGSPPTPRRIKKLNEACTKLVASTQQDSVPMNLSSVGGPSTSVPRHHSPPSSDTSTVASSSNCISSLVIYDDCEDRFILKIPRARSTGSGVTLSAFKDHLARKGFYRYFFKTECPELDSTVVQEEISDDSQELPMHEGRIIAHLKAIPGASLMSSQLSDKK